jgi:uncharacterized protein with ATP-grasp and redox domains
MKTYLDCYPCFVRQALEAARHTGATAQQQRQVLNHVLDLLAQTEDGLTPPEIGDRVHRVVRSVTGVADPYRAEKDASTREALALYPRLKELVSDSSAEKALDIALRLSIAGNIIDLGPAPQYDLWAVVERVLAQPFAIDERGALKDSLAALSPAESLLFLADNAGETVFDRVLIEVLNEIYGLQVIYAVKGGPSLNDATVEDARAAGLHNVATVIDNGADAPGTILAHPGTGGAHCSAAFLRVFNAAPVILAKGQANYECLSDLGRGVFFLLQCKCPIIARELQEFAGVPVGSIVLAQL